MQPYRDIPPSFEWGDCADVIHVRVSDPDRFRRPSRFLDFCDDALGLAPRVNDCCAFAFGVADDVAVLLKRADSDLCDDHLREPPITRGRGAARRSPGASSTWTRAAATGPSAVSRIGDSPMPWCASQRSASSAAMQPVPAEVIACR